MIDRSRPLKVNLMDFFAAFYAVGKRKRLFPGKPDGALCSGHRAISIFAIGP